MTRDEILERGRKIRDEKMFERLFERNKELINKDHYVSKEMMMHRVKKAMETNPHYEDVKSLTGGLKKMLHSLDYISREQLGIENVKEGLKGMKTGRMMKWGKPEIVSWDRSGPHYRQPMKEETMFDVMRRLIGVGKKMNIYWNEDSKTYRFMGSDGVEYEIIVNESPLTYGIQVAQ